MTSRRTSIVSSLPDLMRLLEAVNAERRSAVADTGHKPGIDDGLRELQDRFRMEHRLAVYGTLAPGKPNHHLLAHLGGEWTDGFVEGDLLDVGWGSAMGYRALLPRLGGTAVPVKLLTTPRLDTAWEELDRFEGPDYERVLVPVFGEARRGPTGAGLMPIAVANLYATRHPPHAAANAPSR